VGIKIKSSEMLSLLKSEAAFWERTNADRREHLNEWKPIRKPNSSSSQKWKEKSEGS
jgi:hypothetical protein